MSQTFFCRHPGEGRGPAIRGTDEQSGIHVRETAQKYELAEKWVPAFAGTTAW